MAASPPIALIVGCGVIGLTTGIRLLERGYDATIVARDLPPVTTSNAAAAVWFPYNVQPLDLALAWSRISLAVYFDLARDPATGISLTTFIDLFDAPAPDPWWREAVHNFWRPPVVELPNGYCDGHAAEVPLIETPIHMDWLVERFRALGGYVEQREVVDLHELAGAGRLIFNCTGLGARELAADAGVYPIRGQIIRVRRPAGVDRVLFDEHGRLALAYVIPRGHDVIVGGTAEVGDWDLRVRPETAAEILAKGTELSPALADAGVLEHVVGLRPGRAAVRLEVEKLDNGGTIIHNYGHGGAGFTLAWGCAEQAAALADEMIHG